MTDKRQQMTYRIDERIHRVDTMYIEHVTKASKGKGKGHARQNVQPRALYQMTRSEQWWLSQLWNGALERRVLSAQSRTKPVQVAGRQNLFCFLSMLIVLTNMFLL